MTDPCHGHPAATVGDWRMWPPPPVFQQHGTYVLWTGRGPRRAAGWAELGPGPSPTQKEARQRPAGPSESAQLPPYHLAQAPFSSSVLCLGPLLPPAQLCPGPPAPGTRTAASPAWQAGVLKGPRWAQASLLKRNRGQEANFMLEEGTAPAWDGPREEERTT